MHEVTGHFRALKPDYPNHNKAMNFYRHSVSTNSSISQSSLDKTDVALRGNAYGQIRFNPMRRKDLELRRMVTAGRQSLESPSDQLLNKRNFPRNEMTLTTIEDQ